jgi:hypothetical protein
MMLRWDRRCSFVLLALIGANGCREAQRSASRATASAAVAATASTHVAPSATTSGYAPPELTAAELVRLSESLSEPDGPFFSENLISNETSQMHVAESLQRRGQRGAAYIGVGPEQNFSYIALLEPRLAFVVDIRRDNALLHWLYKVIFAEAQSRTHFLALLLGRDFDKTQDPGSGATIEQVLAVVERLTRSADAAFEQRHAIIVNRIAGDYGVRLTKRDRDAFFRMHRAFRKKGLDQRFSVLGNAGERSYPPFRQLLSVTDAAGQPRSFLASEQSFLRVQRMQHENRVVPVVGDFAGPHALKAIAQELARRDLPVGVFYVSNVEQYLAEPGKWRRWVANVDALPSNERSVFVRTYLEQGRRHPRQQPGHRTTTVISLFDHFKWRQRTRGYRGFWEVVNDGLLDDVPTPP